MSVHFISIGSVPVVINTRVAGSDHSTSEVGSQLTSAPWRGFWSFLSALFVVLLCIESGSVYADFTGPVVSVLDGDTIEVLHNHHPERIRLSGIDCPEKGQDYDTRAKQATSELVFGKEATRMYQNSNKGDAHSS